MRRVSACGPALGPVPGVDTVRFICIAMLSSKVLTPWLSKPGTWPLTNAEAFEPAPGCDGGATFAWVGSVLGFARSTPVGAGGVLGSSDAMAVGTDTDAGGG